MKKIKSVILLISLMCLLVGCNGATQDVVDTGTNSESETSSEIITNTEADSSTQNEEVIMREVVFVNDYLILLDWSDLVHIIHNEYRPFYKWEEDPDTLYAFKIRIDNWDFSELPEYPGQEEGETDEEYIQRCTLQRKRIVRDLLQREGFILTVEESYEMIVVAATREQMERVFGEMKSLGNYYLRATGVIRPDIEEIMKEAGWDGTEDDYSWYSKHVDILTYYLLPS